MNKATILDNASFYILCAFLGVFGFIGIRLFYLQIYLNNELHVRAQKNFTRFVQIPSQRGNILDQHGALIATNRPVINLYWHGTGNRTFSDEQQMILETLKNLSSSFTEDTYPDTYKNIAYAEKYRRTYLLMQDVPFDVLSKILEKFPDSQNLYLEQRSKRYYPHKTIASHVVGYIGALEEHGKMGLEREFEELLHGQYGTLMTTINSVGAQQAAQPIKEALHGTDIYTTLDMQLQKIAEECFEEDHTGMLLVMDPHTGAIEALVSRPTFDPNIFLQSIAPAQWNSLQNNRPFLNRAFNASYPPASPFKLITLAAALELDIISPNVPITCYGYTNFYSRAYHCAKKTGHGRLTVKQAVAQSCNILFFDIAKRISIDQIAEYAHRFGLGQKTTILFPELEGLVPSKAWKWRTKHEPWWAGETLSIVIGQGYLLATPIQIARMISAIFTGYLVKPRILKDETVESTPLRIRTDTRIFLQKCMKAVVSKGSAIQLRSLTHDMKLYAKTGTAQVSDLSKRELGQEHLEHGWFVCYFQYKNEKPLVLVLVLEHVGSSQVATAMTKRFLKDYKELKSYGNI